MTGALIFAYAVLGLFLVFNTIAICVHQRAKRRRRDDLMDVADAVNPTFHDYEIEALRALFHADQNPQPSRRKR